MVVVKRTHFDFMLNESSLVRKIIPNEEGSFFKCVAEVVYFTTTKSHVVERELESFVTSGNLAPSLHHMDIFHLCNITSLFYKRPIIFYDSSSSPLSPRLFSHPLCIGKVIGLALTRDGISNHFDLVYTKQQMQTQAVAQAFIYKSFFTRVSGCDLEQSVAEMLYNKKFLHLKKERKKIFGFGVNPHYPVPQNINSLPPISYRLAKALDTGYYRNTMLDIFLRKKGQVRSMSPVVTIGIPNQSRSVVKSNDFHQTTSSHNAQGRRAAGLRNLITPQRENLFSDNSPGSSIGSSSLVWSPPGSLVAFLPTGTSFVASPFSLWPFAMNTSPGLPQSVEIYSPLQLPHATGGFTYQ